MKTDTDPSAMFKISIYARREKSAKFSSCENSKNSSKPKPVSAHLKHAKPEACFWHAESLKKLR